MIRLQPVAFSSQMLMKTLHKSHQCWILLEATHPPPLTPT
jgi:hypothetical protein